MLRAEGRLAARLVRGLDDHEVAATARVYAVPGARSTDLAAQVDRAAPWPPDVAVVVIGANDLTHLVPSDLAGADLGEAVRRLRATAVEVVVASAPDLSAVAHVPASLRDALRAASTDLRRRQVASATAAGARIADPDGSTTAAFAADSGLFSTDRFHPSSSGYAVIAGALLPEVLAAAQARRA